ncbi:TIGR04282 family arsenosugar biosynthesis glycosyltransferase [Haladaptatus sp. DFWS20]|uniref:TIGR04282 family arsenosugar biosynthesis glycosyltransferase n=1 Tax=Haladaptatus sp. DFWS20 TaxID=3403467 RepID=UPI003EC1191D
MTTIAVLADPPREGFVLPELVESSPLSESEVTELYAAMVKDTVVAAAKSGGDLLVNYRPDDAIPDEFSGEMSSEAELRALTEDALADVTGSEAEDVRFEVQVGETFAGRAGNTATHLLREESVDSVAIVNGTAPMLTRKELDSAAMKLRRSEVVLGPAEDGRAYFVGLTDTIDFENAYVTPELETLTQRGVDAGHEIDFLPTMTSVKSGEDLRSLVPLLNARIAASRIVPVNTATYLHELGLRVEGRDGDREIVR